MVKGQFRVKLNHSYHDYAGHNEADARGDDRVGGGEVKCTRGQPVGGHRGQFTQRGPMQVERDWHKTD